MSKDKNKLNLLMINVMMILKFNQNHPLISKKKKISLILIQPIILLLICLTQILK
jgi:hypothetical protein